MLLFPHKMVFIKNEAVLLCELSGNVQGHLQLQSSVQRFDKAFTIKVFLVHFLNSFGMETRHFQNVVSRMKLFLSL